MWRCCLLVLVASFSVSQAIKCYKCEALQGDCSSGTCDEGQPFCTALILENKAAGTRQIKKACSSNNPTGKQEDGCVKDPTPDGTDSYRCGCNSGDFCNGETNVARMQSMLNNRFILGGGAGAGGPGSFVGGQNPQQPGQPGVIGQQPQPGAGQFPPFLSSGLPNGTINDGQPPFAGSNPNNPSFQQPGSPSQFGGSPGQQFSPSGGNPQSGSNPQFPPQNGNLQFPQSRNNPPPQGGNSQFPSQNGNNPQGGAGFPQSGQGVSGNNQQSQPSFPQGSGSNPQNPQGSAPNSQIPQGPQNPQNPQNPQFGVNSQFPPNGQPNGGLPPNTIQPSPNDGIRSNPNGPDSGNTFVDPRLNAGFGANSSVRTINGGQPQPTTSTGPNSANNAIMCSCNEPSCSGSTCKGAVCYRMMFPANSVQNQAFAGRTGDIEQTGCSDDTNVLVGGSNSIHRDKKDYRFRVNGQEVVVPMAQAFYCRDREFCNGAGILTISMSILGLAAGLALALQRY